MKKKRVETFRYGDSRKYIQFKKGGYRDGVKRKRDKTGMDYTHGN